MIGGSMIHACKLHGMPSMQARAPTCALALFRLPLSRDAGSSYLAAGATGSRKSTGGGACRT
eukprot:729597-Pleurochrysis_carterae.AAC.1